MQKVVLDGRSLTIEDLVNIARDLWVVEISPESIKKVYECRQVLEKWVNEKKTIYGVNTGFGSLANTSIKREDAEALQENLIRSHSVGVGNAAPEEIIRATMAIRTNTLAGGYSGVRPDTLKTLINMVNKCVYPIIPEKGSVGASGDLAPLAHMTLVMIGEGEAFYKGKRMSGKEAMESAGIKPVKLSYKEGLALINGTSFMSAYAVLSIDYAQNLIKCADIIAAMTLEALRARYSPFDKRIHERRPHKGQIESAENIRLLIKESQLIESNKSKVQDAYSLRCIPQVHGAVRTAIEHAKNVIEIEINSVTDNPIIFKEDNEVLSGGNFHGQPISCVMSYLSSSLPSIGNISERRIVRLLDEKYNEGLSPFLIQDNGVNSGFIATHYIAASLASENKILSHPASVDTIPTCANQEDHVSMGTIAARKVYEIVGNVEYILAIELLCAAQALDLRKPLTLGIGTSKAHELVRKSVPYLTKDTVLQPYLETARILIHSGKLANYVEQVVGKLK